MAFKPNNAESLQPIISNIQNCVIDIKSWMTANMLQLNMDKTEALVLMNKSLENPITINKIKIDSTDISTVSSVSNLGAIFDCVLGSEAFANPICKSAWFNLFNISRSRRSLTTDTAKIIIQAYVMSTVNYCNSLLYGFPDKLLNRIQQIQNCMLLGRKTIISQTLSKNGSLDHHIINYHVNSKGHASHKQ